MAEIRSRRQERNSGAPRSPPRSGTPPARRARAKARALVKLSPERRSDEATPKAALRRTPPRSARSNKLTQPESAQLKRLTDEALSSASTDEAKRTQLKSTVKSMRWLLAMACTIIIALVVVVVVVAAVKATATAQSSVRQRAPPVWFESCGNYLTLQCHMRREMQSFNGARLRFPIVKSPVALEQIRLDR